jgi:hypothetical protein
MRPRPDKHPLLQPIQAKSLTPVDEARPDIASTIRRFESFRPTTEAGSGWVIHISNGHRKRYAALEPLRSGIFAQGRFALALDSKNFLIPAENLVQLHDNDASSHKPLD